MIGTALAIILRVLFVLWILNMAFDRSA